ncbi:MAG TPA: class I SAM-dependent methyltransferase [Chloroflexota bacterium]
MPIDTSWIFNLGAAFYAWFTAQPVWRESCRRMAERLPPTPRPRVVDLGCGPGVCTAELARRRPDAMVVGLDVAPRMLAEARRRYGASPATSAIAWVLADAAALPFQSASLDAATGHSVLYLLPDRARALAEARRVLRPGGRLVVMEPNAHRPSWWRIVRSSQDPRYLLSVLLWRPMSRLHGRFTVETLRAALADAGFAGIGVEETLGGLGLLAWGERPSAPP